MNTKIRKNIYIIIVNWNRWGDTLECLNSLSSIENNGFNLNVVLVDNDSKDESVQKFKKYKARNFQLKIIENDENSGFAKGNNIGINYALKNNLDYALLLNNDTIVDKKLIINLLKASEDYPDVWIFTPKIYFAKGFEFQKWYKKEDIGRVIWSAGGNLDWKNVYATNNGVDIVDKGQFNSDFVTDFATGAAMFLKKDALLLTGGFDEKYYLYMEDVDLCERYRRTGRKIMFVNKALLWHKVSQSSGIGSNLNDYFITRNRLLYAARYAGIRAKFALLRESIRFIFLGRPWQKKGVIDYFSNKFYRGSWK